MQENFDNADYLFDIAFEAILCTGINRIGDIYKLKKIAREYYRVALKNDAIRNPVPLSKRQLAES